MGLARKPKAGSFPLSSVPVLPPVGLPGGAHTLFLLRGAFRFQPLLPHAPDPHELSPSSIKALMERGAEDSTRPRVSFQRRRGGRLGPAISGDS